MNRNYLYLSILLAGNIAGLHCMENAENAITPASFNPLGKTLIELHVMKMQRAAKEYNITTGLASIFNEVSINEPGINQLIHTPEALQRANEYYNFLQEKTTYPTLTPLFEEVSKEKYLEACFATDIQRTLMLTLLYPKFCETSAIRMPEKNMLMNFAGTTDEISTNILRTNIDVNVEENRYQVFGTTLMLAYCLQNNTP